MGPNPSSPAPFAGMLLRDAVNPDPAAYLGAEHVARHGAGTELLVKLLDAGERLAVHSHPDTAFARERLDEGHGRTESWIVLSAERGRRCNVGLREETSAEELAELVGAQDAAAMLAALNAVPARTGDVWLVPAGLAHAFGVGARGGSLLPSAGTAGEREVVLTEPTPSELLGAVRSRRATERNRRHSTDRGRPN